MTESAPLGSEGIGLVFLPATLPLHGSLGSLFG